MGRFIPDEMIKFNYYFMYQHMHNLKWIEVYFFMIISGRKAGTGPWKGGLFFARLFFIPI